MTTASMPSPLPSEDIVEVLRAQHDRIRVMLADVQSCPPDERQMAFDEVRAFLAVHEAAEEIILRPATRRHHAEQVADERNSEEKAAARLLADLEQRGVDDPGFEQGLMLLQEAVVEHAAHEERIELPRIIADADTEEREMLGRRFLQAERLAPTHPHPGATGSTAAVLLTGPFASMLDRAKDALHGRPGPETD